MMTASLTCAGCGNVNPADATHCLACEQVLQGHTTVSRSRTGLLTADHLLKQRYRIIAQIGKGGFAAVYQAADSAFGDRLVAIKEMSQNRLTPQEMAEATEAFKGEALLLAKLRHPNLPRIYDHFSDAGRWYLVMDFIEGQTLEERLHSLPGRGLPAEEVLAISLQLCSVLHYLHTHHPPIIFRDLKPANVIRTPTGHLYLIDFGIARHFKPGQSKDTTPLGSPGYAAPEQYGKGQTTPRADIYSLGVTLHHLLTGSDPALRPFRLAPLQVSGHPILSPLETLIKHMSELDEANRPQSIAVVTQALQRIANQQVSDPQGDVPYQVASTPQTARPTGTPLAQAQDREQQLIMGGPRQRDPLPRRGLSRRSVLIGAGAGLLALAAGGMTWRWLARPQPQVRTGTGPNMPAGATHTAASSHPVKSGVELTEGLRLHMVSAHVGWAIGASAHNNNWATVLRTTDGGSHWKQVTPKQWASQGIDSLYIIDETTAWLPGQERWYRTTDGGATWQPLGGLQGSMQPFSFSDQNHGWMIALSFSGETHHTTPLYTTSDGGNTWQQTSTLPFSSIRAFHAITEQTGWVTTQEFTAKDVLHSKVALYVTHDAGRSWEQRQLPTPAGISNTIPSYTFGPTFLTEKDGSLFAAFGQDATHDMYLYVTHDGGTSWQVQGNAIPGYVGVRSVVDDQHIIVDSGFVGGDIQMDLLTLSNGQWHQQDTHPVKGGSAEMSFPSASTGLALVRTPSNDFDVYRTNNAGKTWQKIATLPSTS